MLGMVITALTTGVLFCYGRQRAAASFLSLLYKIVSGEYVALKLITTSHSSVFFFPSAFVLFLFFPSKFGSAYIPFKEFVCLRQRGEVEDCLFHQARQHNRHSTLEQR